MCQYGKYCLSRDAHRYFLEPLAETPLIKNCLWSRFIRFVASIANGKKENIEECAVIKNDVRKKPTVHQTKTGEHRLREH